MSKDKPTKNGTHLVPAVRKGEASASMLTHRYHSTYTTLSNEIMALRETLIEDLSGVMSKEEAILNVDHFLIGLRKPSRGFSALYATEDGQRLWSDKRNEENAPTVSEGEVSAGMLKKEYRGSNTDIHRELTELRKELIDRIVESKVMSEEEATLNVEHFLIGMRRRQGSETLHATPEGERIWLEDYKREKKLDKAEAPSKSK